MTRQLDPVALLEQIITTAAPMQVVAAVEVEQSVNLRWALSSPTTNGDLADVRLTITALHPRSEGWAYATRSGDPRTWSAMLDQATAEVRQAAAALEGAAPLQGEALAGYSDDPDELSGPQFPHGLARAFEDPAREYFGYAEESVTTTYIATTSGWRWRQVERTARLEMSVKDRQRERSAWAGLAGQRLADLDLPAAMHDLHRGLDHQRRQVRIPAEPTTVILSPSAVADLMLECWRNADARDASEGRSAYSGDGPAGTALGSRVSSRDLSLTSNPRAWDFDAPRRLWTPLSAPASTVFDSGAELAEVVWINGGHLDSLAATRAAAQQLDLPFVASPDCLALTDSQGHGGLADLVARTRRAVLVTSLWYIRDVDPQTMLVTGLTRDGCYLVEDGAIVGSTGNFRFNDSPLRLLDRVTDASATSRCLPREWADYFTRTAMPALVVEDFGLSTPSESV